MQLVTDDAINYLGVCDLETVVLKAICVQAGKDFPDDPIRAAHEAKNRQIIVETATIGLYDYPEERRAILMGYWKYFGGR